MPPVVVRDLLVHPRENDLVVGTYGIGAWITDISPLQQFTEEVQKTEFCLFEIEPKPQMNFSQQAFWGNYHMTGSNHFRTSNEPNGFEIWYYFRDDPEAEVKILVIDENGKEVHNKMVQAGKGIQKYYWNTMKTNPGEYMVTITWNGKTLKQTGTVKERWQWPVLNYR